MARASRFSAILLALLFAWPAPSPASGDLDALVGKVIDAYGGEKALRKAAARKETGTVRSPMAQGKGTLRRAFQYPDKLRVEIGFPGRGREVRVVDGQKGWRQGDAVAGPQLASMALQAARLALPLALLDRKAALRDSGEATREGKTVRVIEYPPAAGMNMAVEIDPGTGRIVRTVGTSRESAQSAVTIEFVTEYGDFKKKAGVLFAFREQNFAMGTRTGETVLGRVDVRRSLPAETFKP